MPGMKFRVGVEGVNDFGPRPEREVYRACVRFIAPVMRLIVRGMRFRLRVRGYRMTGLVEAFLLFHFQHIIY